MNKMIYCEVDRGTKSEVSRTLTGDHESRVTDTGGVVIRCVLDMGDRLPCGRGSDTVNSSGKGALIANEVCPTLATIHSFNAIVVRLPTAHMECNEVRVNGVKTKSK